jgi:DNA-binding response OmpR family regulator
MKILYLEDNQKLADLTSDSLRKLGMVVEHVLDIDTAENNMNNDDYDIYLLDRMLEEGEDSIGLCRARKKVNDQTPIMLLTALSGSDNRIDGLMSGADDYMEKPFDIRELVLRIQKLAVKLKMNNSDLVFLNDKISVDISQRVVYRGGEPISLTPRQWGLLEYLILNSGNTVSKSTLIDRVWGVEAGVLDNAVEAIVKKLRSVLGDEKGILISTQYGFGYKLNVTS